MIYVLGVLTLVALIGLTLIARTHGESKRVIHESTASSGRAALNGVIRIVQETLRNDVWGFVLLPGSPRSLAPDIVPLDGGKRLTEYDAMDTLGTKYDDEPYDAPGENDRWLASTLPYLETDQFGNPVVRTTYEPADPSDPWAYEPQVLTWHGVSYLGTDIIHQDIVQPSYRRPFAWANDSRTDGTILTPTSYSGDSLQDVPILQTPPPGLLYDRSGNLIPLIPGSTTNVTIAQAREGWRSPDHQAALVAALGPDQIPRFPYFDTNADGIVDLYDADGDGVPDSPISFVVPQDSGDPNAPKQLYAVIRVVDHASMLNANVASSLRLAGAGTNLTFDESLPGLQRRGRRQTELLLDEVAHRDDAFLGLNRTAGLVAHRWNAPSDPDPRMYDVDIVRRKLLGGLADAGYLLYGLRDEASLRHRGILAPRELGDFDKQSDTADYRTIDRALRWSLLWSRQVGAASNSYLADAARWNRLNADYEPFDTNGIYNAYEGYDDATRGLGWRTLLQEDGPAAIRRPMFTTVSHEVVPGPSVGLPIGPLDELLLLTNPVKFLGGQDAVQMTWPVLPPVGPDPTSDILLPWMRRRSTDINMGLATADPNVIQATKELYVRYLAAAMYMALADVGRYQLFHLTDLLTTPNEDETLNRQWLAWQFALNMADYRDSDGQPTVLEWFYTGQEPGPSRYLYGVEKQPFITEAYAYLVAGTGSSEGPDPTNLPPEPDSWFFAVELFLPPHWIIAADTMEKLYLRCPGVPGQGLLPLNQFLQSGGQAPILDGGLIGRYFVFSSDTTGPTGLDPQRLTTFYSNPAFEMAVDGAGSVELVYSPDGTGTAAGTHVLDVIGPAYSGGDLAGDSPSGAGIWAKVPSFIPDGAARAFSLQRSTKSWRFTTCWHVFSQVPGSVNWPDLPTESLGAANEAYGGLVDNIPESVWPTLVTLETADHEPRYPDAGGNSLVPGFASGLPYEVFDSVAEISRVLMIGSARFEAGAPRLPSLPNFAGDNLPVTALLALTLDDDSGLNDLPGPPEERIAAGRVDFVHARKVGPTDRAGPWTWRLFDYLTAQSHLYDGVDNDGDDPGDGTLTDLADPDEGARVLYRLAGRININTAPLPVLRSVPFMSLLPTSAELQHHFGAVGDLAGLFNDSPALFWDIASAIVAKRENRFVPLRMREGLTGLSQTVAVAAPRAILEGPGPSSDPTGGGQGEPAPFTRIAELAELVENHQENVGDAWGGNDRLFQIDRFWADRNVPLWSHKVPGSSHPDLGDVDPGWGAPFLLDPDAFSPDFRYRGDGSGVMSYVPIVTPPEAASNPLEAAGIRGRDVLLARWANLLTTRSDVFTAYIALLDEDGNYVQRTQVTLDRSECFRERPVFSQGASERRGPILPKILSRSDSSYTDDTR
jgi:hypothetical protein